MLSKVHKRRYGIFQPLTEEEQAWKKRSLGDTIIKMDTYAYFFALTEKENCSAERLKANMIRILRFHPQDPEFGVWFAKAKEGFPHTGYTMFFYYNDIGERMYECWEMKTPINWMKFRFCRDCQARAWMLFETLPFPFEISKLIAEYSMDTNTHTNMWTTTVITGDTTRAEITSAWKFPKYRLSTECAKCDYACITTRRWMDWLHRLLIVRVPKEEQAEFYERYVGVQPQLVTSAEFTAPY